MKRSIIILAFLALFVLAGCEGDFASPTTTDYQTETTTTTTTAAAEMTQTHNRSVCVGVLNLGSCNTVQVNTQTQTVNRPAGAPAPTHADGMTGAGMVGTTVLLCLGFIFCMFVAFAVMGDRGYN